jgi:hypothetical protein
MTDARKALRGLTETEIDQVAGGAAAIVFTGGNGVGNHAGNGSGNGVGNHSGGGNLSNNGTSGNNLIIF